MIPHNGRGTYRPAQEMEPYLDWIVPVNHLLADDLIQTYRIPPSKIRMVYLAINPDQFQLQDRPIDSTRPCQVVTIGRVDDLQKNILSLPAIIS